MMMTITTTQKKKFAFSDSRNLGLTRQTVSNQLAEGKFLQSNLGVVILETDAIVHYPLVTNLERTVHSRARPPYHTTTTCPAVTAYRLTFSTRKCLSG